LIEADKVQPQDSFTAPYTGYIDWYPLVNDGPALTGFRAGKTAAEEFEQKTNAQIKNEAVAALEIMFGESNVPSKRDIKMVQSDWGQDGFSRGAYAYLRDQDGIQARKTLGGEVDNGAVLPKGRLFFAGEHTSPDFPAYMTGAVQSGNMVFQSVCQR
jgi:monoamine oxidase